MVGIRLTAIRRGRVAVLDQPALFSVIQERVDWLAVLFVLLAREGVKFVSLKFLFAVRKLGSYLKIAGIRIEKRFERVIDLIHGKGAIGKKGAVSFFLREIAENKGSRKPKTAK
jgi:hypothetical protein